MSRRVREWRLDHRKHFLSPRYPNSLKFTTSPSLLVTPVVLRGSSLLENGVFSEKKRPWKWGEAVAEECGPLPESGMQMIAKLNANQPTRAWQLWLHAFSAGLPPLLPQMPGQWEQPLLL